jgi:hypothetical protein
MCDNVDVQISLHITQERSITPKIGSYRQRERIVDMVVIQNGIKQHDVIEGITAVPVVAQRTKVETICLILGITQSVQQPLM